MDESGKNFEAWLLSGNRRPLLMGILNTTPDSFSEGGSFFDQKAAISHGLRMIEQGASIIDVGGESTRPGSLGVEAAEQIRRVVPVIESLRDAGATLSIDTSSAIVAEAAIEVGATIINDITAGQGDPAMFTLAAEKGAAIILMHMQGTPRTMQSNPEYADVVGEVRSFLHNRAAAAEETGIARHRILLDVGIGFGKTLEHNLSLLRHHNQFTGLGHVMVLGTSRKGFIGTLTDRPAPSERLMGTAATIAWGLANGADILRVHDVSAMNEVVQVITAIRGASASKSGANS